MNILTKSEAKEILRRHNNWRRSDDSEMESPAILGQAIDVLTAPNEIAQELRYAAINWPSFISDVGCNLLYGFCGYVAMLDISIDFLQFQSGLCNPKHPHDLETSRLFMLFVAEALES